MFLVHNEQTKLTATWLNTLATALVAAGVFAPAAALAYQLAHSVVDARYMFAIALGCLLLVAPYMYSVVLYLGGCANEPK